MNVENVKNIYNICCTCLSANRNLYPLIKIPQINEIFKLLVYDFARDHITGVSANWICFECVAMMRKISAFKWKVHTAQEHLHGLSLKQVQDAIDPSLSLSTLVIDRKSGFDKTYEANFASPPEYEVMIKMEHCGSSDELDVKDHEKVSTEKIKNNTNYYAHTANKSGAMPTLFIKPMTPTIPDPTPKRGRPRKVDKERALNLQLTSDNVKLTSDSIKLTSKHDKNETLESISQEAPKILCNSIELDKIKAKEMLSYTTEYMSDDIMLASREEVKKNMKYITAYNCELCFMRFECQSTLEKHIDALHTPKPGMESCKICQVYVKSSSMISHTHQHHLKLTCKVCSHIEYNGRMMQIHIKQHREALKQEANKHVKKRDPNDPKYKTTINGLVGYKCGKCEKFFEKWYHRQTHMATVHGEMVQCDHCDKLYKNKQALISHLKREHGPQPLQRCPACRKMLKKSHFKSHLYRHNKGPYKCLKCHVSFKSKYSQTSHMRYHRAHADRKLFAYPCTMDGCGKGYPSKQLMLDHYNYTHFGKTLHNCTVCDKVYSSEKCLREHSLRVHRSAGERRRRMRSRDFTCQVCGKVFQNGKYLSQHMEVHSEARPLECYLP